jgi:hypothetical protein
VDDQSGARVATRSVGLVVLALLGGVVADRWRRSMVLTWSNLGNGLTQGAIVILLVTDTATVPRLITLSLLAGGLDAMSFPILMTPVGQAVAGPLAVAFGLSTTLVGAGALVVVCCLAALAVPAVRHLRPPSPGAIA